MKKKKRYGVKEKINSNILYVLVVRKVTKLIGI